MSDLKAVLVDLGGTLISPEPAVEEQYYNLARDVLCPAELPDVELIRQRFLTAFHHSGPYRGMLRYGTTHTEGFWFWKRVISSGFPGASDEALETLTRRLYDRFRRPDVWRLHDGACQVLSEWQSWGLTLAIVTNWDRRARALIQSLNLESQVDLLAISSECGIEKPDPRLFRLVLEELDQIPCQALMIGNHPEIDLKPAKKVGMKTILYRRETPNRTEWPRTAGDWQELSSAVRDLRKVR